MSHDLVRQARQVAQHFREHPDAALLETVVSLIEQAQLAEARDVLDRFTDAHFDRYGGGDTAVLIRLHLKLDQAIGQPCPRHGHLTG